MCWRKQRGHKQFIRGGGGVGGGGGYKPESALEICESRGGRPGLHVPGGT